MTTVAQTVVTVNDRDSVLSAARDLAPEFSARASEGEALRTMPADLVSRVKKSGLFRLALPRSLGGLELDPLTIVEVVELVSAADGSAGWTVLIGNSTTFFAWLEPDVARAMIGSDRDFCSTSMFGPLGRAHPGRGGRVHRLGAMAVQQRLSALGVATGRRVRHGR